MNICQYCHRHTGVPVTPRTHLGGRGCLWRCGILINCSHFSLPQKWCNPHSVAKGSLDPKKSTPCLLHKEYTLSHPSFHQPPSSGSHSRLPSVVPLCCPQLRAPPFSLPKIWCWHRWKCLLPPHGMFLGPGKFCSQPKGKPFALLLALKEASWMIPERR